MGELDFQEKREIRVFISSTFKDMVEERKYLITKVFPSLRHYCEEREVSLFELDLRWGITEEESKQGKVVDICLREIQKTKPFFIGLLGERYGWVPNETECEAIAKNTSAFEDFPLIKKDFADGTSITEIEMQEGVLRSKENINAYFYFRSPKMETPAEFIEKSGSHEADKLAALKQKLEKQGTYPVKKYDSIEHLGKMVKDDFEALINKLFPLEKTPSPLEKERAQQRNFLKSRTQVYVPNPQWDAQLNEFMESDEKGIVIAGESGMGKSAFLANWIKERLEKNNQDEKIIYHFIGASQSEGDYRKIIQRLIDEVRDIYKIPAKEENTATLATNNKSTLDEQKKDELQKLLIEHTGSEKLIIILDGINWLSDADAKLLHWLYTFPENVKGIYSTEPGDTSMDAFARRGHKCIAINAMPLQNREQLIKKYLASFSKSLSPAHEKQLAADKENESPLILLSVLDELRVFGIHEKLNEQIGYYLAAPDNDSLFALILQKKEELFMNDKTQGNIVIDILSLIAVSRYGLSETEILEISKTAPLYWSQLFNAMAGQLTTRNGIVSFSNHMIQDAVIRQYLPNSEAEKPYRSRIASYMETLEQKELSRKCDELPYQLFELKEWDKLYHFLLDYRAFSYIFEKDKFELGKYWRALRETDSEHYTPEKYFELTDTLVKETGNKDYLLWFCDNILYLFYAMGDYSLCLEFSLTLSEIYEETMGKNHPRTATVYTNVGACYRKLGDYVKALEYLEKALAVREAISGENSLQLDTAYAYDSIGICYFELGEYEKALNNHKNAILMLTEELGKDHPDTRINYIIGSSYTGIGNCYLRTDDYETALGFLEEALKFNEATLGKNHPDTATAYNNVANCYYNMGDYDKAFEYYKTALAINEKILGENHPETARNYNNIGTGYFNLEYYGEALECYKKALIINETGLGESHPDTVLSYYNIGNCYYGMDDYGNALEFYKKIIAINDDVHVKGLPDASYFYSNIGDCHFAMDDYEKAFEYYKKALAIQETAIGRNHPDIANSYNDIGNRYISIRDYEKAIEYQKIALSIYEATLGKNHHSTGALCNNIGHCYFFLGDSEKALEFYNQALSICLSLGMETEANNIRQAIENLQNKK